jgi:hypothetical protein
VKVRESEEASLSTQSLTYLLEKNIISRSDSPVLEAFVAEGGVAV